MTYQKPDNLFEVITGKFWAGEYPYNPGADNSCELLAYLLEIGVTLFIDLTEEDEYVHYKKFLNVAHGKKIYHTRYEIENYSVPTKEAMNNLLNRIDEALQADNLIYMHSGSGIGRTGTVIACWLIKNGRSPQQAIIETNEMFKQSKASSYTSSPDNIQQIEFINNYT